MWWHTFVQAWNGLSILRHPYPVSLPGNSILTDASGTWGCGAILHHRWFQWQWSSEWTDEGIMAKELVPIVLAVTVWGPYLKKKAMRQPQFSHRHQQGSMQRHISDALAEMHVVFCGSLRHQHHGQAPSW